MKSRGYSLIEVLVGTLILGVIMAGAFRLFTAGFSTFQNAEGQNIAYSRARTSLDLVCDHLRNAQSNTNNAYVLNSAIHSASPTAVTYYADAAGDQVTYRFLNGVLERVDSAGTTVVVQSVASVNFSYFKMGTYNGNWVATDDSPSNTDLPNLALILVQVGVDVGGYTVTYESYVRLRNSPRKVRLSGS